MFAMKPCRPKKPGERFLSLVTTRGMADIRRRWRIQMVDADRSQDFRDVLVASCHTNFTASATNTRTPASLPGTSTTRVRGTIAFSEAVIPAGHSCQSVRPSA